MSDARRYAGKVALVTGAAGGIGRATAERLAREGAALLLADLPGTALEEAAAAAQRAGARVLASPADVTRLEDFEGLVARADRELGGWHRRRGGAARELPARRLRPRARGERAGRLPRHALRGAAAAQAGQRGGGAIVNLASVAGVTGDPNISAYVASKHAVIGLTRSGALAFGPAVRVNAVAPSPVETRMMRSLESGLGGAQPELVRKMVTERIPAGRYAEPAEVAALIAFLGSDEARFINGSIYTIDGGMTPV